MYSATVGATAASICLFCPSNSGYWSSGYTINVKISDDSFSHNVYYLFNHIITAHDYYHSLQVYTGTGNTYVGSTVFKTFAGIAIGVDFGRSIYPKRMRIAPRAADIHATAADYLNAAPRAFKIFASNDDSCWNNNIHSSSFFLDADIRPNIITNIY
jgi:hypothetical protein